jgi:hypothetical protein
MASLEGRLDAAVRDAQANALDPRRGGRGPLSHWLDPADAVLANGAR